MQYFKTRHIFACTKIIRSAIRTLNITPSILTLDENEIFNIFKHFTWRPMASSVASLYRFVNRRWTKFAIKPSSKQLLKVLTMNIKLRLLFFPGQCIIIENYFYIWKSMRWNRKVSKRIVLFIKRLIHERACGTILFIIRNQCLEKADLWGTVKWRGVCL